MALDDTKNFCKVTVSTGYTSTDTSIDLVSDDGAKLPTPPFNLVWYNETDYPDVQSDPNKEIVRVTAVSGDTLTVTRGQEGTTAVDHNLSGKTYKMINTITKKMIDDINNHITDTSNPHQVNASQTEVEYLSGSTYKTIQDWLKTTQSAGKISGGEITDNGDGTVSVASGEGFIKTSNSDTAETKFLTWNANSSVSLADNDTNYIYVEYNSGTPQIVSSTNMPSDKNTNILLGIIYREGTDLHITTAGQLISNYANKDFWKDMEVNGKFQRASGLILSESGTRNIAITAGSIYEGLTKKDYPAFDSSGTDTYTQYYRDGSGGWTKVTGATQEDNQYYDDGSGTLKTLSNNYYTCRYVYMGVNGDVFVVYGQTQHFRIADAIEEDAPTDIPDILKSVGILIGKLIVREGNTNFKKVYSAFETSIAFGTVADHNELGNLQGGTSGEYYHLTSAEYTRAQNAITKVEDDTSPKLGGDLDGNSHNIDLNKTTHANQTGIIYKNGIPFIHDFNYGNNGTVTTEGRNLFIGLNAGNFTMGSNATEIYHGSNNVGIGANSLRLNTTGSNNVGIGLYALNSNTTGNYNVGIGLYALNSNTTGNYNVGIGANSLNSNTTGSNNVGIGLYALNSNTTGNYNVGIGLYALNSNTTGYYNVGIGVNSLNLNTTGSNNVGIGLYALNSNTTGNYNVGIGLYALNSNTTGYYNVGIGANSLNSNTTGSNNVGIGVNSGRYIADGSTANETSSNSIYVGSFTKALTDGDSNEIVIGYNQIGYGSNTVRIGNLGMGQIGTTLTPRNNHDLVIELTNNTTLTFKLKGTDGTVRTATITLS